MNLMAEKCTKSILKYLEFILREQLLLKFQNTFILKYVLILTPIVHRAIHLQADILTLPVSPLNKSNIANLYIL